MKYNEQSDVLNLWEIPPCSAAVQHNQAWCFSQTWVRHLGKQEPITDVSWRRVAKYSPWRPDVPRLISMHGRYQEDPGRVGALVHNAWISVTFQYLINKKKNTELKWEHSLKIATRVGQPERTIIRRTTVVQEGGYFGGCIISHVHSVSLGAWEITIIVNIPVENRNSTLEFKILLTLFHN